MKNYRNDFNKGKRQYGDTESSKHQQQNYNKPTDYSDALPIAEPNARTIECEPLTTFMQTPHQMYSYHDAGDPGNNMYQSVPFSYGMYPQESKNSI